MAVVSEARGPRKKLWDCGVPVNECTASLKSTNMGEPGKFPYRAHSGYDEAAKCAKRYCKKVNENAAVNGGRIWPSKPQSVMAGKAPKSWMHPKVRG